LWLYFKFIINQFNIGDLVKENFFFINYTLNNFIFEKSKFLLNNTLKINDVTSLSLMQMNFVSYDENYFIIKNIFNRYIFKFLINFLIYSNYSFEKKLYYLYIFNYINWNKKILNLLNFNMFNFYITNRTKYYYLKNIIFLNKKNNSVYNNIKFFLQKIFINIFSFLIINNYPYYFLIFKALGLQNYLYLPFKYRFASFIESFFSLINFQNFSENYEKDFDNLIFNIDNFINRDNIIEDEEDFEDFYEFEYNRYKENDYFALFFIEELNSVSYYITSMYDNKFGLKAFLLDDYNEYDSL